MILPADIDVSHRFIKSILPVDIHVSHGLIENHGVIGLADSYI